MTVTEKTWPVADLLALAAALLEKSGLDHAKAETVAELLVEADLMGHDTHGLALLPRYLEEIAAGAMTIEGEPHVIRDTGSCITWTDAACLASGSSPWRWISRSTVR